MSTREHVKKVIKHPAYQAPLHVFALIGMLFVSVYIGMQFGLLNVRGTIDSRNSFFTDPAQHMSTSTQSTATTTSPRVLDTSCPKDTPVCSWTKTSEWVVVKNGLMKDAPLITRVSQETGVPARLIAAVAVPEQLRFFTANREVFKRYFEPLKILGSLTQFSLGVTGIKIETAMQALEYAASSTSSRYPGDTVAALVASTTKERVYAGLTDEKNHYYAYLYTALIIKELQNEWSRAGFPLDSNSGAIVTLFNIGFGHSHPHASPQTGGAIITVGGTNYSYGSIGQSFYDSDELTDIFPR